MIFIRQGVFLALSVAQKFGQKNGPQDTGRRYKKSLHGANIGQPALLRDERDYLQSSDFT